MNRFCIVVLFTLLVTLAFSVSGFAQTDCSAADANTPYFTRIYTKLTNAPDYCYSTGNIILAVSVVGGGASNSSE